MRTRPGRSRNRLRRDYRGGGGPLPSRWRESCDYPAATLRGAALSEQLSGARRLSRAKWSATIERLLSDYRRTNPAPKFFQTFQNFFKNPIRIFSKPSEKSSGFFARQVRGCRGGAVSARAARRSRRRQAAGLAAAELRPPRASWLPSAGIVRTACGRRGCGCRAVLMRGCERVSGCNGSVGRVRAHYGVLMALDR